MQNLFGVMLFHTSIVKWCGGGVDVSSVYVHSPICETYKWCNGMPYTYGQLEWWGVPVSSVYVHSAICETYLV